MSLLDLTLRNVQRNFRLYTIYLLSMILGAIIHFTFSSLMFNEDILQALENRDNFKLGVAVASVVIFLFIIFFILYANSFFMRQRKKEFGMYLLFGMSERQITRMVFYETLIIGAISVVAGTLLGGLLSKLFGMLLMKLMQYDQVISLSFPLEAIGTTVAVFLLLAVIISAQSYIVVHRVRLIELFRAKEKMEKPIGSSTLLAMAAIILLGAAFAVIAAGTNSFLWEDYTLISMLIVTVGIIGGTFLFFRQFVGWLLAFISRRRRYHEGSTMLWSSALRFQVRSNTLNLTFISQFSALIVLLTCFVTINYKVQFEGVGRNLPNDIAYEVTDAQSNEAAAAAIEASEHKPIWHRTLETVVAMPTAGMEQAFESPADYYSPYVLLVPERTYHEFLDLRDKDDQRVELADDEAVSLSQGVDIGVKYASGQEPLLELTTNSQPSSFRLKELKDYALLGWITIPGQSMQYKPAVVVISDAAYDAIYPQGEKRQFEIYQVEDAKNAEALSAEVYDIVAGQPDTYYSSYADVYSVQIEGSALMLFASAFLALIAIFALASVIYFKQLKEATEAQQQYAILRKIGVGDRQMKGVIRKQLLFVFSPPLVLGMAYSWFIIKYAILDSIQGFPGLTSIVWGIMGAFFLIYALFYLSSAKLYYQIVTSHT
ncbi:putative ABC transport system permease protein [Paenibacillus phyllosphaerae]|uniref:Putative ABC transport system permease protein n=1 Tax=Paenibacillus phyllosphaerae TaxID=274593 RepID=A0A7W5B600_9BACL|nr:ABC transporter permease [Paenibacillus phyllosphaerae]MBB3114586.1 putative ABC transport system permease protein [Paenibacillus phyllosphaerae]